MDLRRDEAVTRGCAWHGLARQGGAGRGGAWPGTAGPGPAGRGLGANGPFIFNLKENRMLYEFRLEGVTPLLIHSDDVEAADRLQEWRRAPKNKDLSKPGDDRSPAWTWQTYLYTDGKHLTVPADNLMVALRQAGATKIIKGNKTYKEVTQAGMVVSTEHLPILVGGKPIDAVAVSEIEGTFREHKVGAEKFGFRLFVKRAKVGQAKHVRVRPRFDEWVLTGSLEVIAEEELTPEVLLELFEIAGKRKGICDWRPSSPRSPGPFGKFKVELKRAA